MATPTTDHQDHRDRGCGCHPWKLCSLCMGRLQRMRSEWALRTWLDQWDAPPVRQTPRARPFLRLVTSAR